MIARIITFAILLTAAPAFAGSNVSPKFDGRYAGSAQPVAGMSRDGCEPLDLKDVSIAKGVLRSAANAGGPTVGGFITEECYVAGRMARPGGKQYSMDGRLEDGVITAGFIEAESGCAWIVHLVPLP